MSIVFFSLSFSHAIFIIMSETRRKRHRESGSGVKGAKFLNWLRKRTKLVDDESLPSSFSTRGREIEDGASLQSSEKEKERSWRAQQRALENDIQATADQINSVQKSIDALQPQIEEAGEKAQELLGGDDPFENERFKYWRAREAALYKKEEALHEEKVALIQKETVSETALHQKEHDLQKKEAALIQKETVSETALHQKEHDLHEEKMALAPKEGSSTGKISFCVCVCLFLLKSLPFLLCVFKGDEVERVHGLFVHLFHECRDIRRGNFVSSRCCEAITRRSWWCLESVLCSFFSNWFTHVFHSSVL